MSRIDVAKGKAKWTEAEYLALFAAAYRVAINAAREIDQQKIADDWEMDWREIETASVRTFAEAKALGYFGEK